jgi:predicted ATPase/DNA-binding winged helix-turn-helix (wHTH) protein
MAVAERLTDEPWRVDWPNACVWQGDAMVRLPPKACAVLRLLVEQAGQLVPKEALLEAIWPEAVVSEAVLTVCIGELRKALRDSAKAPRFIETVHRRGYRFIGPLPAVAPSPLPLSPLSPPRAAAPAPQLVGRAREFTHLHQWLDRVRQGARQIVWLTGEPGMGKTTIVNAFMEELARAGEVWLAWGQCIEHYGAGEAYLPVLEALGRLCREPASAALLPVLEQHAPTWLVQMPALLNATALATVQRRSLGATQERMLREFAEAVEVLTASRPLLLILEDLHWSDYATLDLLTYLGRRAGPARLLIVGTYRPVEVLLRQHPLAAVKQDLVLHGQAVELPLELLTAAEVAQYLALRCTGGPVLPPACRGLAQLIYQRTDGQPLFLVTVVEHVLQQGGLRQVAGQWEVQHEAALAVMEVPASVRQMIEQQFAQLSPEEQRVLEAASVAGNECAVAAVAAGLELALEAVEDRCAGLAQRGRFLVASGLETWPDGTVTERYRWQHAVHQEVVYARIPVGQCLRLHRRIGAREEMGYGARASEIATELAVHFEQGRDYRRAVQYVLEATRNAARRGASQEVIALATKGVALLAMLPEAAAYLQQELDLQVALSQALIVTKGYGAPDLGRICARARELCEQIGDTQQIFPVLRGLMLYYLERGHLQTTSQLGEQLLSLAQAQNDPAFLMLAHYMLGMSFFFQGELTSAHAHHTQVLAIYTPQAHRDLTVRYDIDPGVGAHCYLAWELWQLGYPDQAVLHGREAYALVQEASHPHSLAAALVGAAFVHQFRREALAAQGQVEAVITHATEQGFAYLLAVGTVFHGWVRAMQGQGEQGLAEMRQGIAACLAAGSKSFEPYLLGLLAETYGEIRHPEAGLSLLNEGLSELDTTEVHIYDAELSRLKGTLLLQQAVPDASQAEACFRQALDIARQQQAKSWELRAAISLARLWQQQGKRVEAHALLASVYGWFTEGFQTPDFQEAKRLLEVLA